MWRKAGRYTTEQKNIDGASQLIAYYLPAFPCPWFLPSPVPNVSEVSNRNQISSINICEERMNVRTYISSLACF